MYATDLLALYKVCILKAKVAFVFNSLAFFN